MIHALIKLAGRLAVLYSGAFLASGTPEEVLADKRVANGHEADGDP